MKPFRIVLKFLLLSAFLFSAVSCSEKQDGNNGTDPQVTTLGHYEVTAKVAEIRGELIDDPLYDYAHVIKYRVLKVHRGSVADEFIYVGHYNPAKPRSKAADSRAPQIGGTVTAFHVGDVHRMALEVPIDDYYMGGVINKYFAETNAPVYWALWTNSAPD